MKEKNLEEKRRTKRGEKKFHQEKKNCACKGFVIIKKGGKGEEKK